MRNIKLTKILGLLCCLLGGSNAYGQVGLQGETWANSPSNTTKNVYLYEPNSNVFLKHENTVTSVPNDATMFTFSGEKDKYNISYTLGNRTMYVYNIEGKAVWGATNTKPWAVEGVDGGYRIFQQEHNPKTDEEKTYKRDIRVNGGTLEYNLYTTNKYTPLQFISEEQYNAAYPQNMIRKALGNNQITCGSWYSNVGHPEPIRTYQTSKGVWLTKIPFPKGVKGVRSIMEIDGLLNTEYDIEFYAKAIGGTSASIDHIQDISHANDYFATANINIQASEQDEPQVIKLTCTPRNGKIWLGFRGNAINLAYASIKSIKYHTPSWGVPSIQNGEDYYLYNVGTGNYLDIGGTWARQAVAGHGFALKGNIVSEGNYTFQSFIQRDSETDTYLYIRRNKPVFLDGKESNAENQVFTKNNVGENATLSYNGLYLTIDPNTGLLYGADNGNNRYSHWKFQTYEDRKADLQRASSDNPMDATFLIKVPGFDLDDAKRSFNNWTGYDAGTDPEHPLMGQVRKTYLYDLPKDLFKNKDNINNTYWDAVSIPTESVLGEGITIYGSSNVDANQYADITNLGPIRIYGDRDTRIRILYHNSLNPSVLQVQIIPINNDGFAEIDLSSSSEYTYLNAIKIDWGSSGRITGIKTVGEQLTALEISKPAFDIYQEITDVPEGFYLLSAQGVHYDPLGLNPVVELYANNGSTKIVSAETDRYAAFDEFKDGGYKAQVIAYVGADHTLKIGARSKATDGATLLDNFELTYFGRKGANFIDVTDMYIKNSGFQGSSNGSNWRTDWKEVINLGEEKGDAGNKFAGYGYFAGEANRNGTGHVLQDNIYLPAGAYRLSALVAAQNVPASLFVTTTAEGRKQNAIFIDKVKGATGITVDPQRRNLDFIMPQSGYVSLGFEYYKSDNAEGYRWVAVDNFKLEYQGDVKGFDITCQMVNPDMNADNEGLPESEYGWDKTGSTGFTYEDVTHRTHGVAQIYNKAANTYQVVSGLPDGWYEIETQGFYRDAPTANKFRGRKNMFLYGNNTYAQIQLINSIPGDYDKYPNTKTDVNGNILDKGGYTDDLEGALKTFNEGNYKGQRLKARVTNGELTIGFLRDEKTWTEGADWTVINYCKLKYLHNDAEISDEEDFTQFIKNPSFEAISTAPTTRCPEGWTVSSKTLVVDNLDNAVMTNGDGRYLANTGSPRLNYYYVRQKIKGGENGLPQGTYALKVKFASTPNNRITMSANGRMDSTKIALSDTDAKEFTLNGIGINNNEEIDIEFASNFGFKVDDVRLVKGEKEGDGVAIDRDLDGLIEKARIILGSDFIEKKPNEPFKLSGNRLQTALDYALTINKNINSHYRDRKAAKEGLMAEIRALETIEINPPTKGQDYMVNHVVSNYYLSTKESKVDIEAYPAKLHFTSAGDNCYYISDATNENKKILKAPEGNALSADAANGTKVHIKVVFIENVPSHYAISTVSSFDIDACLGTVNSTLSGAPVYTGQDGYDGMSRWFISNWSAPELSAGGEYYLYNVEAGAFLTNQGDESVVGWPAHAFVDSKAGMLWSLFEPTGTHEDGSFRLVQTKGPVGRRCLFVTNDGKYGISMYVDGVNGTNYKFANDVATGYYTIGVDANDDNFGDAKYGSTHIGWTGEDLIRTVIPMIAAGDTEPRGTHWILCNENQYKMYRLIVPTAYEARCAAWPVYRSALRSANMVDVTAFAGVYNNPLATAEEIEAAKVKLEALMNTRSVRATTDADGFVDYSYRTTDLDCQNVNLADGGWTNDGYQTQIDNAARHNETLTFGRRFYEKWIAAPSSLPSSSLTKTLTSLPEGYYTLALDAHAEKQGNDAEVTGVKLFLTSSDGKEVSKEMSTPGDRNFKTYITDTIRVVDGATLTLGVKTENATANWVAFDNFRLRYHGPIRDHWTDVAPNTQKTINFTGTWRDTEEDEIKDIITTEGKGVTIDMEDATILDPVDITLENPENVLVYVPAGAEVTVNGEDKNVIKDGDCKEFYVTDLVTLNIIKQFKAHKIYYSRNMNGWSYASLVLPYALHTNSDVQVYRLFGDDDANGRFLIERINDNAAGVPALMRKKNPEATKIEINEESVEGIDVVTTTEVPRVKATNDNIWLIGSYVYDTVIGKMGVASDDPNYGTYANNYYYYKNDQFVRGKNCFYCDAFRTYIDVTEASLNVRARSAFDLMEWEEPDGIETVRDDVFEEIEEVYGTNGVRKAGLSKGINIVKMSDGQVKKIIVK